MSFNPKEEMSEKTSQKTKEEIFAMAKVIVEPTFPGKLLHKQLYDVGLSLFYKGYTSNTELEDFKKRLVEKVEEDFDFIFNLICEQIAEDPLFDTGEKTKMIQRYFLDLITQDDQPPVKKEEI